MTATLPALDRKLTLPGGIEIPLIGFGTYQLVGSDARQAVGWALEAGYRHFDTAASYGNEADIGAALAEGPVPRGQLFLTTKLPPAGVGRELEALHQSLAALGTDYVDLWLIHHPQEDGAGLETWRRLIEVRDAGLARAIGVSNFSLERLDELARGSRVVPAVNQIRWNPFLFDRGVWKGHLARGIVLQGYTPFRRAYLDDPVLVEIAEGHGRSPAQVIVRWHLQHGVIVMPRSARRERIWANADVAGFELSGSEMGRLDARGGTYRGV